MGRKSLITNLKKLFCNEFVKSIRDNKKIRIFEIEESEF